MYAHSRSPLSSIPDSWRERMQESTSSKPVVNSSSMSFCPSAGKAKRNFKVIKSQPWARWPGINFRDLRHSDAEKYLKLGFGAAGHTLKYSFKIVLVLSNNPLLF